MTVNDSLQALLDTSENIETKCLKSMRLASMDLLARREHSAFEIAEKLHKRFANALDATEKKPSFDEGISEVTSGEITKSLTLDECVERVITQLQNENLQSDQRFAESFVRSRANRGQGPKRIQQDLRAKGISECLLTAAMEQEEIDWFDIARDTWSRKFSRSRQHQEADQSLPLTAGGSLEVEGVESLSFEDKKDAKLQKQKHYQKQQRFLQYRGFSFEHIRYAMNGE